MMFVGVVFIWTVLEGCCFMANQTTNIKITPNALKVKIAERQPIVPIASDKLISPTAAPKAAAHEQEKNPNLQLKLGSKL